MGWIIYMMAGNECGLISWHLSYSWGKLPEITSTRKLTLPGIEPGATAWGVTMWTVRSGNDLHGSVHYGVEMYSWNVAVAKQKLVYCCLCTFVQTILNTVNTMRCVMALVRGFPCQSAFRRDTCCVVLRAKLSGYTIGLKTSNIKIRNAIDRK